MDTQPELTMNKCNDPDHGAINAERDESRGLRKAWIELDDKRQSLERELAAMTKQRDEAREDSIRWMSIAEGRGRTDDEEQLATVTEQRDEIEAKLRIELRGHPDSELWGDAGLIAATMRCVDALGEVTDQRDEWKAKYIQQNKELGCEQMDPNGTIWDYAKRVQTQLSTVTEQRDELARQNKLFRNETLICADCDAVRKDEYNTAIEQRDMLAEALQKVINEDGTPMSIDRATKTLQSLTQTKP